MVVGTGDWRSEDEIRAPSPSPTSPVRERGMSGFEVEEGDEVDDDDDDGEGR